MTEKLGPQEVFLTGEVHGIRLVHGETASTVAVIFRLVHSQIGKGQVAFLYSDLKGDGFSEQDDYLACLTDNVALAHWLKDDLGARFPGFIASEIADREPVPIIEADHFASSGDLGEAWTETVRADQIELEMTWRGLIGPVRIALPPTEVWPFTVYSMLVPASSAEVTINGVRAVGQRKAPDVDLRQPLPLKDQQVASQIHGSCCMGFGETWLQAK